MIYLDPPEPTFIDWREGIVRYDVDREWWNEKIGWKAKTWTARMKG